MVGWAEYQLAGAQHTTDSDRMHQDRGKTTAADTQVMGLGGELFATAK